jgi:hypothetical protein
MAKFVKLSTEEVAQLSPEEKEAYLAALQEYTDNLEKANEDLLEEVANRPELTMSKGRRPEIKHNKKKYRITANYVRIRPAKNAPFETYDLDAIVAPTKEGAALRDLLIEKGSGILVEVKD